MVRATKGSATKYTHGKKAVDGPMVGGGYLANLKILHVTPHILLGVICAALEVLVRKFLIKWENHLVKRNTLSGNISKVYPILLMTVVVLPNINSITQFPPCKIFISVSGSLPPHSLLVQQVETVQWAARDWGDLAVVG